MEKRGIIDVPLIVIVYEEPAWEVTLMDLQFAEESHIESKYEKGDSHNNYDFYHLYLILLN